MNKIKLIIGACALLVSCSFQAFSQSGVGGNFTIHEGGSFTIFGTHSFKNGSGFIASGVIKTARTGTKGYLNFGRGSSWVGADETGFVDGYVKVYHDNPFVFPIGQNGQYRPLAISGGAETAAAYYNESPKEASFSTTGSSKINSGSPVNRISNKEYWEVSGPNPIELTLTWGADSEIGEMTANNLSNLSILGWKDGEWKELASKTDAGGAESLTTGSSSAIVAGAISTTRNIIPDDYTYFTLGAVSSATERNSAKVKDIPFDFYPNPVDTELNLNLESFSKKSGTVKIYNLYGQLIEEQVYDGSTAKSMQFDTSEYVNGLYEIYIKIGFQESTKKFVVNRTY